MTIANNEKATVNEKAIRETQTLHAAYAGWVRPPSV